MQPAWASNLDEATLDEMLLARVADKAKKARDYPWDGPLILLVRNPYQAYHPSDAILTAARATVGEVFDEAWLVNHREGVDDVSPPEPRLVRLD